MSTDFPMKYAGLFKVTYKPQYCPQEDPSSLLLASSFYEPLVPLVFLQGIKISRCYSLPSLADISREFKHLMMFSQQAPKAGSISLSDREHIK